MGSWADDNLQVRSLVRAVAAAASACLFSTVACSGGTPGVTTAGSIRIGVDLPLSGHEGQAGIPTLNGVEFFVHRHPTLDGFSVVVDARDDAVAGIRDPAHGVQNVQTFIDDPTVLAVIGPLDSSVARAEIPVANAAHLAMVSPATSNRCLTKEPLLPAALNPRRTAIGCQAAGLPSPADLRPTGVNNYFRLSTTDDLQGPAAADYGYKQLHLLRVAVLSDHEAYGQALADSFTASFARLGGTVVDRLDFDPSPSVDLRTFLQQAKKDGAQGVYFGGSTSHQGCKVREQMAGVFDPGEATPFLGGNGIAEDPACVGDAGDNAAGIYATVPSVDAPGVLAAQPVIAAFRSEYGRPRDYGAYTLSAYDAAGVVYDALDRAIRAGAGRLPGRDGVVTALAATTDFQGVTGTFGFDPAGDTTLRVVSIYEPAGTDPRARWKWVGTIDYSTALPY
ncbi:hypothetical protein EPN29_06595 [bacterium]|nr:MAG: hypothetical protein EPN29_06595 [bacterium]